MKNNIGTEIRKIRQMRGLTILQLADKIGIKWQQLQRIELTGKASVKSIQDIANALEHAIIIFPVIKF
jgi:transcriptional regulator with XRE-family HTH domain